MQTLVIYDISHDGTREKVADVCLDYGLDRVQFSAFLGELSRNHQESLMLKIKRRMGKHGGHIWLLPICERDWARRIEIKEEA
ncbi:MAG: CRISPR-associated endonuclease Cas2 [Anaerolineales bacterium]|nr:CRISPR-associated endonuclease Cas2 [Anaerolineales bacterium]MCB9127128.1 CRISPR-associated endonuclease Cas2 [Ardenticatenales bacterium]